MVLKSNPVLLQPLQPDEVALDAGLRQFLVFEDRAVVVVDAV